MAIVGCRVRLRKSDTHDAADFGRYTGEALISITGSLRACMIFAARELIIFADEMLGWRRDFS